MPELWSRIGPWLPDGDQPDDGDAALRALADVAAARRLLEQAELSAVRTARRHRKSWTEIATMLAITRQSAWERWRELDPDGDTARADSAITDTATALSDSAITDTATALSDSGTADTAAAARADSRAAGSATGRLDAPGRGRRRRLIEVPDLVGYTAADALGILTRMGLEAVSATPGLELLEDADELRPTVVVRQYPDPGTRLQAASTVRLWLERGDGEAGVREPRRPVPPPRTARTERDERVDAVG